MKLFQVLFFWENCEFPLLLVFGQMQISNEEICCPVSDKMYEV